MLSICPLPPPPPPPPPLKVDVVPALLCAELGQIETKMSIFSNFFNSNVPKIDPSLLPHIGTMFNFVEIYRFVVNPLMISQNFISISYFIKKLLQKSLWRVHSTMGGRGLNLDKNALRTKGAIYGTSWTGMFKQLNALKNLKILYKQIIFQS